MESQASLNFYETMVGKMVRCYKGGPESRIGRLIAVKPTHIVLDEGNDGVIYFNIEHVKSVVEDTQQEYPANDKDEEFYENYVAPENWNEVLESLRDVPVKVDRGGPESRQGRIIGVGEDFFVLSTNEEGELYYNTKHIKSISEDHSQKQNKQDSNQQDANNKYLKEKKQEVLPTYIEAEDFSSLLSNFQYRWVKINRGGPESVEGILSENTGDYIILISNKEVYRISTYHIRNISYKNTEQASANQDQSNQNNNQNSNQNSNQNQNQNQNDKNNKKSYKRNSKNYNKKSSRSYSKSANRSSSKKNQKSSSRRTFRMVVKRDK